jgi:hypothetical protein
VQHTNDAQTTRFFRRFRFCTQHYTHTHTHTPKSITVNGYFFDKKNIFSRESNNTTYFILSFLSEIHNVSYISLEKLVYEKSVRQEEE